MKNNSYADAEIYPDQIFLDSRNIPTFDTQQFEGRIERPITQNVLYVLAACFLLVILVVAGKLFSLQITNGNEFFSRSINNTLRLSPVAAERGVIKDARGTPLAWNDGLLRTYTASAGFSHLLGYVGHPDVVGKAVSPLAATSSVGIDGIELSFDETLAGVPGAKMVEIDALGRIRSESIRFDPLPGKSETLSIDARLQEKLYGIIASVVESRGFKSGAGILMDVETGEIIALTSFPEYDSSILSDGSDKKKVSAFLTDPRKLFLNRAVGGIYAPGSIIKPFMALAALQEGVITPEKSIYSSGALVIENPYDKSKPSIFKDWKAHGWVNMREAIAVSSDEYFYQIGGGYKDQKGIGIANIEKYARLFGFGEVTGVELGKEGIGTIPSPAWKEKHFNGEPWRLGNTYHTVIGQYGFQVTPIQVVRAYAALANGGTLLHPTIRKIDPKEARVERTITLPASHFTVVREGMHMGSKTGTAKALNVEYLELGAKTGTAELGAGKDRVNSWVTGFFPYEKPRYAFAIVLESGPKGNTVGGVYVMRQLLDWMFWNTPEYLKQKSN